MSLVAAQVSGYRTFTDECLYCAAGTDLALAGALIAGLPAGEELDRYWAEQQKAKVKERNHKES